MKWKLIRNWFGTFYRSSLSVCQTSNSPHSAMHSIYHSFINHFSHIQLSVILWTISHHTWETIQEFSWQWFGVGRRVFPQPSSLHGLGLTYTHMHSHLRTISSVCNWPILHILGLWGKSRREKMQTPHRKASWLVANAKCLVPWWSSD